MQLRKLRTILHAVGTLGFVKSASSARSSFGPADCVSLSRSEDGTCVMTTDCGSQDISKIEFSFDCQASKKQGGGIIRHSFGVGGFDPDEEFDTSIQCEQCLTPARAAKAAAKKPTAKAISQPVQQKKQQAPKKPAPIKRAPAKPAPSKPAQPVVFPLKQRVVVENGALSFEDTAPVMYGPNECVATYKSPEGHCIVQTQCAAEAIATYEFGLVCVDEAGMPFKHMFGTNSFDPVESFDTLIPCNKCLGLEDLPPYIRLSGAVANLTTEISAMKMQMQQVFTGIGRLREKVLGDDAPPFVPPVIDHTMPGVVNPVADQLYPPITAPAAAPAADMFAMGPSAAPAAAPAAPAVVAAPAAAPAAAQATALHQHHRDVRRHQVVRRREKKPTHHLRGHRHSMRVRRVPAADFEQDDADEDETDDEAETSDAQADEDGADVEPMVAKEGDGEGDGVAESDDDDGDVEVQKTTDSDGDVRSDGDYSDVTADGSQ